MWYGTENDGHEDLEEEVAEKHNKPSVRIC